MHYPVAQSRWFPPGQTWVDPSEFLGDLARALSQHGQIPQERISTHPVPRQCRRISINGYRMRLLCRIDHLVKNGKITPHREAPLRPAHGHASDDEWLDGRRGLLSAQEFRTVLPQDPRSPTPNAHRVSEKTGDQCRYQGQHPHAPRSRKLQGSRSRSVHTIHANVLGPRLGSSCSKSRCRPTHPRQRFTEPPLSCGADIPSPRGSLALPSNASPPGQRQPYRRKRQPSCRTPALQRKHATTRQANPGQRRRTAPQRKHQPYGPTPALPSNASATAQAHDHKTSEPWATPEDGDFYLVK